MSSKSTDLTRREFLSRGATAAAGVVVATSALQSTAIGAPAISSRVIGANDTVNVAVAGIRGRGKSHIKNFGEMDKVHVKTLCDVDQNLFPDRVKLANEAQGSDPGTEADLRRLFNDKDIDAIAYATPNHWHALGAVWAVQAGKHVYVEKPSSHNVWEGRKMVEAARKYNKIVQVGFQSRSNRNIIKAIKFIHDGGIGEVYMARGLCFKPRNDIGRYPDGPMKAGEEYRLATGKGLEPAYTADYLSKVDYDLWLGPAPKKSFNRNRFHYNWHWHWDYGNGDTGNQGPHQFDIARWGLNKDEYPVKVRSFGGMFAFDCSQETPNTQTSIFEYADGTILEFGTRGLYTNAEGGVKIGNIFYGSEGWLEIGGGGWRSFMGRKGEPGPSSQDAEDEVSDPMNLAGTGGGGHFANFIAALRSGKSSDLNCDIEVGHMSSALPMMANISYLLGRDLVIDGAKEQFVDDKAANKMLTRSYRKPYVIPKRV